MFGRAQQENEKYSSLARKLRGEVESESERKCDCKREKIRASRESYPKAKSKVKVNVSANVNVKVDAKVTVKVNVKVIVKVNEKVKVKVNTKVNVKVIVKVNANANCQVNANPNVKVGSCCLQFGLCECLCVLVYGITPTPNFLSPKGWPYQLVLLLSLFLLLVFLLQSPIVCWVYKFDKAAKRPQQRRQ